MSVFVLGLALAACGPPAPKADEGGMELRGRGAGVNDCLAEHAVYTLRSAEGPELALVRNPAFGPQAPLFARVAENGATHWFWLRDAPSFGAVTAVRGPDPTDAVPEPPNFEVVRADVTTFTAFTPMFDVLERAPRPGDAAPAHIFAPDLGVALMGGRPAEQPRQVWPVAMWDFARCAEDQ